ERVSFSVQGKSKLEWSIIREKEQEHIFDHANFSKSVTTSFNLIAENGKPLTGKDNWRVAIVDQVEVPDDLTYRHKRTMKYTECGIAALVCSKLDAGADNISEPEPRIFTSLPLPFPSGLPVNIHATFLTSGDRQAIAIEDTMKDAGSEWNK